MEESESRGRGNSVQIGENRRESAMQTIGSRSRRSCRTSRGISLISRRPPAAHESVRRTYEETRKKRRACDTMEQFGSVFRRSAVICLPTVSPGVSSLSRCCCCCCCFSSASPRLSLSFCRLGLLPRLLTRGALPTCQRYIFCRATNRLAGNFEIGTLI